MRVRIKDEVGLFVGRVATNLRPGDQADLPDAQAAQLIQGGAAEPVHTSGPAGPETAQAAVQTAQAAVPAAIRRRRRGSAVS